MKNIRIGIIGTGIIGKHHIKWYNDIKGAEIIAVCDNNKEELEKVRKEYSIPKAYTDYHDLLQNEDIDAVDVCLHTNLHRSVTIAALEAGKHVYCEKPIAGSYIDGKNMVDKAKECGKMLQIQLWNSVFLKETKAAKTIIDAGRLGKIYHARSTGYRRRGRCYVDGYGTKSFVQKEVAGGGALFDMGVYHIARIMYLIGMPEPERITGKVYQEIGMDPKLRKESGFNVEELALGFVTLKGNITLDIIESWAIHLDAFEPSSIVGSEGGIRLDPFSYHSDLDGMQMNATFNIDTENERKYNLAQRHWIEALQNRVELIPTSEVALKTMLIQEGIYLSDQLGREVTAEEVKEKSVSTALR